LLQEGFEVPAEQLRIVQRIEDADAATPFGARAAR
jgi:hypothetical protein